MWKFKKRIKKVLNMRLISLINNILTRLLIVLSPRLGSAINQDSKNRTYYEIGRNSKCYCESGKKYKHCHLLLNEKKGKKAVFYIDSNGEKKVKTFKGTNLNIPVQNTFNETDIGVAAGNPRG
jgi:hypothetical protein